MSVNVEDGNTEKSRLTSKENTVKVAFFAHGEHSRDRAATGKSENSVLDEKDLTSDVFMVSGELFQSRKHVESLSLLAAKEEVAR